ncbi:MULTISPECIES: TatD family hydrolase [unclassified Flavobacterium]|uniref:TatD family hydrolase n=1 Tax=unclassified Flavobacterium TaxID=196869 RepID=UPI000C18CEDE|nr:MULTISPECIES: TatD family hydrolase [unclassified Flavobacterium]PIF62673.1 TatD DNase family protein [Flavobacterium sp. 11]WKL43816.1 TatD family hydrolase [Flavobacterium sp. ZE23DGlu08]
MEFFNLHTHKWTNQPNVLELVNQYPQEFDATIPYYSIGIHPWFIVEERLEADLAIIESKLQETNCLAVGECGLDKRIDIPMELQQLVFEKHLLLAQQYQKPVVIHCVAAFQELIAIKKKMNITVPILIHGFSKNAQVAKQLLDNGFHISFGKYLLLNKELETVFKSVPDNRFFLETDTVEEGIEAVYKLAAKYKGVSVKEIQKLVSSNFLEVFNIEL